MENKQNRERQLRKLEPANGKLKPGRILVNHTLDVRVHFFIRDNKWITK